MCALFDPLSVSLLDHHSFSVASTVLTPMDKDNRDDFTFAKLSELKLPVTFRVYEPQRCSP